jgi:hypothetical protein
MDQKVRFEPMTAGMLLDRSFRIYFQNLPLMVAIAAFAYLPLLAFNVLQASVVYLPDLAQLVVLMLGAVSYLIGMIIVGPMAVGATTTAVSDLYLGNPATAGEAFRGAWRYIVRLILTQFVVTLIVMLGLFLLIVPGNLWWLSYMLVIPVAVLEPGLSRAEVRRRSWELVRGHRGKVFVVVLVMMALQLFLIISGEFLVAAMGFDVDSATAANLQLAANSILGIVGYPFWTIVVTLLYYDLRIRKEGFDLEMHSLAMAGAETEP